MSQFFKSKASTLRKVAELPRFRHPADLLNMPVRDIKQQKMEIQGQIEFNANKYISPAHENLIKKVISTRQKYRTATIQDRLDIAAKQYGAWDQYLNSLVQDLSPEQKVEGTRRQKVYESYLIGKQRNQERMQMAKVVRLFYELQNGFKLDIAIDPFILLKLIHPHFGYLNNFTTSRLPFDNLCNYFEQLVAISKILSQGNTLHADQLLSFNLWRLYCQKPTMNLSEFGPFLKQFKFDVGESTKEDITNLLAYNLKTRDGQIKQEELVRFDFWRNVYLQRGL